MTVFSQKTCSGKAGSLVREQVREGKEATSGCKDRRSHGGSLGRPRRCPAASPLAPMPLRSPRGTAQVTPQSVPVGGNWSTCFPRPIGHWRELLGWAVDKIPRGCGPPRRQGGAPAAGRPTQRSGRWPLGSGVQWGPVRTSGKGPEGTPATGTSLAACSVGVGSRARTTSHPPAGEGGGHSGSELGCGFGAAGPKPAVLVSLSLTRKVGCWRVLILRPVERV